MTPPGAARLTPTPAPCPGPAPRPCRRPHPPASRRRPGEAALRPPLRRLRPPPEVGARGRPGAGAPFPPLPSPPPLPGRPRPPAPVRALLAPLGSGPAAAFNVPGDPAAPFRTLPETDSAVLPTAFRRGREPGGRRFTARVQVNGAARTCRAGIGRPAAVAHSEQSEARARQAVPGPTRPRGHFSLVRAAARQTRFRRGRPGSGRRAFPGLRSRCVSFLLPVRPVRL